MEERNKTTEICFIAPSEKLGEKARRIIAERNEAVDVYVSALEDAIPLAKRLESAGARVIISRKGTKAAIEQRCRVTVVGVHTTLTDYVEAMKRAKEIDGPVAFFSYEEIGEDIRTMCYMMPIQARYYRFKNKNDCRRIVKEAIREGARLGIGGVITDQFAAQYQLPHIIVENSEVSIMNAIETAKQILAIQKEEERKQEELTLQLERYKAILNFTHDAIIAVDEQGKINVFNPVAQRIIQTSEHQAVGKNIDDVLPNTKLFEVLDRGEKQINQLMSMKGTLVSTNRIPIVVDGKIKGVVATFQDIKTIQDNEKKIRISLHEKGLVAKYHFGDIKGSSPAIQKVVEVAKSCATSHATVLIHGETGTGKELFAQSLHNGSSRKDGPFVAINCAALSKNLLESELFGYVEGAFTGAVKGGKAGLFELAHKGTIFLDEIGEIPVAIQVQLLRVLQEKEIRRIGSDALTPVDVRVITATNKDLKVEIQKKAFREDLYYRLNVLNLELPPLRERSEDVVEIALDIFRQLSGTMRVREEQLLVEIIRKKEGYPWPGNARELHNFVERLTVLLAHEECPERVKEMAEGWLELQGQQQLQRLVSAPEGMETPADTEPVELVKWEKESMINALKNNNLVISRAAKELGMSRTTFWRKMKEYQIKL